MVVVVVLLLGIFFSFVFFFLERTTFSAMCKNSGEHFSYPWMPWPKLLRLFEPLCFYTVSEESNRRNHSGLEGGGLCSSKGNGKCPNSSKGRPDSVWVLLPIFILLLLLLLEDVYMLFQTEKRLAPFPRPP